MQNDCSLKIMQDDWTLSGPVFGLNGQVSVIGWIGRFSNRSKIYLTECSICKSDPELYGSGRFTTYKASLVKGSIPCGCSTIPKWSQYQYSILCTRMLKTYSYHFIGWSGDFIGRMTKVAMLCDQHGQTCNLTVESIVSGRVSCPGCHAEAVSKLNKKPDDIMISSFLASGAFHPDTKFWRSDRKNLKGSKAYWYMSCPECGETGEILSGDLQKGKRPCACSPQRQQECYINWVVGEGGNVIAIKFGIANKTENRVIAQDRLSSFKVINFLVYSFPTVESCKKAERDCKKSIICGLLTKQDMPDGYTETTSIGNLPRIIEIYTKNGGQVA